MRRIYYEWSVSCIRSRSDCFLSGASQTTGLPPAYQGDKHRCTNDCGDYTNFNFTGARNNTANNIGGENQHWCRKDRVHDDPSLVGADKPSHNVRNHQTNESNTTSKRGSTTSQQGHCDDSPYSCARNAGTQRCC